MSTVLICGHRAYAAKGLKALLERKGHHVLEFSRGELGREGRVVVGPVTEIDKNPYFVENVDFVVNFILLQNGTVEENCDYINALVRFCKQKNVKRLIQISSISSYSNDTLLITEATPVDNRPELKGGYGVLKVVADKELEKNSGVVPVSFVRPGYIVANDNPHPFKGIALFLCSSLAILMGDKKATLPCIGRTAFHECLSEIIADENPLDTYLLVEGDGGTKFSYFKSQSNAKVITLPKKLILMCANVAKSLHLLSERKFCMVKGLFKCNKFDCSLTKSKLKALK